MKTKVTLIRGDGIGPEISHATLEVIAAAKAEIEFEEQFVGLAALDKYGELLPSATLQSIEKNRVALKGPLTTPKGEGFRSVNVALRQHFDLYSNVRPVYTMAGVPSRYDNVDIVVVRENTEDLYAGIEHWAGKDAAESICLITRPACERIIHYAFKYAKQHGRKKVCLVHKANIMKLTSGLFLNIGRDIARQYPEIVFEELIVDAACMKLVTAPEKFDVIVTTNLFGDILSDLVSGLVGGLGVAPGANLGEKIAIFEAVHGSAPDIAGQNKANPTALILAAALMLEHIGQSEPASRIRVALTAALQQENTRTPDLGGKGNTLSFMQSIIDRMP